MTLTGRITGISIGLGRLMLVTIELGFGHEVEMPWGLAEAPTVGQAVTVTVAEVTP